MSENTETSDKAIIDLLRQNGPQSVAQLAAATGVTATAVRQRLGRLLAQELVERRVERSGRGRPTHQYSLTKKGVRHAGTNYADLVTVLWHEVRSIRDPEFRRGLLKRLVATFSESYKARIKGDTLAEKMDSLADLMCERDVPFTVTQSDGLPVLTALACPYPDLAEQDPAVCAMERMLFSEVLGEPIKLSECRLQGSRCCTFEAN